MDIKNEKFGLPHPSWGRRAMGEGRKGTGGGAQSNVSAVHAGRVQAASSALPAGHPLTLEQLACAWGTCLPGHFTAAEEMAFCFIRSPISLSAHYLWVKNLFLEPIILRK